MERDITKTIIMEKGIIEQLELINFELKNQFLHNDLRTYLFSERKKLKKLYSQLKNENSVDISEFEYLYKDIGTRNFKLQRELDDLMKNRMIHDEQQDKNKFNIYKELTIEKYSNCNHVMIDIETLGKKQNRLIFQISAMFFNPLTGKTYRTFNRYIDIEDSIERGFKVDGSTLQFWFEQKDSIIKHHFVKNLKEQQNITHVLLDFTKFLGLIDIEKVQIYGNGPTFDTQAIIDAYNLVGINKPWMFFNERCQRTLEAFAPFMRNNIKKNNKNLSLMLHDGLVDSKIQIMSIHKIISQMNQAFYLANKNEGDRRPVRLK